MDRSKFLVYVTIASIIAAVFFGYKYYQRLQIPPPSELPIELPNKPPTQNNFSSLCQAAGGTWIGDGINECESTTLPEDFCRENGGTFSECLSPCRHSSPLLQCAEVCMRVCKF